MPDLTRLKLSDMTQLGADLRRIGANASSMEEVAQIIGRRLYGELKLPDTDAAATDAPACALVRTFVTMPYSALDAGQREAASTLLADEPQPTLKCLTLLATIGSEPDWNDRTKSRGHQAIPLPSERGVSRLPMIAQLIRQLGLEIATVISPRPDLVVDLAQHTFNVFHVADALDSPYIPAQQAFVIPHGIRSVVGFGGVLPPGELFATILFSRVPIPRESAELFKTLALNVKVALLPFAGERVFS
jgi:hypothetical protein